MKKANIVCALVGMTFSASAFLMTLGFRKFKNVPIGPEFFPRYLAGGLFICSAILLIQALRADGAKDAPAPAISIRDKGIRRLLIGAALIVVYALGWKLLGFVIATPLAMFSFMFLLGMRRYALMALFSVGAVIVIFCAFRFLLGIDMPPGLLEGLV